MMSANDLDVVRYERDASWWRKILARTNETIRSSSQTRDWINSARDGDVARICKAMRFYDPTEKVIVVTEQLKPENDIWFIGDIHGDLLGLEAALEYIEEFGNKDDSIIFLGDFVDDGFHCAEVILRIFDLALSRSKFSVSVVVGNHDEALRYVAETEVFESRVDPGDFARWLNRNLVWHDLGRAFIHIMAAMPRAIFFPTGLFASHAGFPHSDTWATIPEGGGPSSLGRPEMLRDYTWNRLSLNKRKIPNRSTSGCEFGCEDFFGFCRHAERAIGRPVCTLVRGHDHVSDQAERFSRPFADRRWAYNGAVLTINNMSYALPRERRVDFSNVGVVRKPVVAQWSPSDANPILHVIDIAPDVVQEYLTAYAPIRPEMPVSSDAPQNSSDTGSSQVAAG